jgi:hypothetical protein
MHMLHILVLRTTPASAPARMHVLALPARMALVGIKPPAQHEMLAALVGLLHGAHRLFDQLGEFAVGFIAALVGGVGVLGVGLHAGQRRTALAQRRLAGALLQLCTGYLGVDFGHGFSPC